MSTEEAKALLQQLRDLGVRYLTLSGGEPFLRKDLYELVESSSSFDEVVVTTNATVLGKADILRLSEFPNLKLSVSLDGLAKTHDKIRGVPGTFAKVCQVLGWSSEAGLPVFIRMTLTRKNYGEAVSVYHFLARFPCVRRLNLRPALPVGRGSKSDDLITSPRMFTETLKEVYSLATKGRGISVTSTDPVTTPVIPDLLGRSSNGKAINPSEVLAGCFAGEELIYINAEGYVGPCSYLPADSLGCFPSKSMLELIASSALVATLRQGREAIAGVCRTCKYLDLCGGCRARALALTGDVLASDPFCLIQGKDFFGEVVTQDGKK